MLPKVDVSGFLPKLGDFGFGKMPNIHMPDLSFGKQGFMSGSKSFNTFFGGGNNQNTYGFGGGYGAGYSSLGGDTYLDWGKYFPSLNQSTSDPYGSYGMGTASGGASILNQYDTAFQNAARMYGFDPNWIKAVAMMEEGWTGTSGAGAIGIMQIMPGGYTEGERLYPNWKTDPYQNIMLGAYILNEKRRENGGDLYAGTKAYLGSGTDPYTGVTTDQYLENIRKYYAELQANGGKAGGGYGNAGGVIGIATSFVGKVPYVWGGIPGKGENPTGWDCSGFTYWLDQNYGTGTLPMGSHYQYQYFQQNGGMFFNMSQLRPGDLVFFDTGNTAGAGANLNRAGHVAIYIGNGQIVHAANESQGTIISNLSDYYASRFIGAAHMSW